MSDAVSEPPVTVELGEVCLHCDRPLVLLGGNCLHATVWDESGHRELYRHCRKQVATPADGIGSEDDLAREAALTAYFRGGDTDWEHPDLMTAAGFLAFRAGWQAARG